MNFGSDECTEISLVCTKPAYYFEACGVQRFHLQEVCALALYPAKNEEIYGNVPYQKFSCHVTSLLKRTLQHVGHKWVICGLHPDCSVGQWVKCTAEIIVNTE